MRAQQRLLAAVALCVTLGISGLAQAQYQFTTIDFSSTNTSLNGNSTHEIVGNFDDADGNTHGFVLNKGGLHPDGCSSRGPHDCQWDQREG